MPECECGFSTPSPGAFQSHTKTHTRTTPPRPVINKMTTVQIHIALARAKIALETLGVSPDAFRAYDALQLKPFNTHASRERHLEAVLTLADCISQATAPNTRPHALTPSHDEVRL